MGQHTPTEKGLIFSSSWLQICPRGEAFRHSSIKIAQTSRFTLFYRYVMPLQGVAEEGGASKVVIPLRQELFLKAGIESG